MMPDLPFGNLNGLYSPSKALGMLWIPVGDGGGTDRGAGYFLVVGNRNAALSSLRAISVDRM